MQALMPERIDRMKKRLSDLGMDGLLLFDMKNIRYLTGFTGSEGACVIGKDKAVLLVDGRYLEQAREQVRGIDLHLFKDKLTGLAEVLSDKSRKMIGFESSALSFDMYLKLKKRLRGRTLRPVAEEVQGLRILKDDAELALISQAVDVSHQALRKVMSFIKPGVTERDVATELEYHMKSLGAEDLSFPTIVASGPRAALPHAEPGQRRIQAGDAVIIDYGAVVEGYHSDETCTFLMGGAHEEIGRVYAVVKEAHDRAIAAVRAGVSGREIDRIARDFIEAKGFGDHFPHGTGHGVGLDVHEAPRLAPTSDTVLQKGMVVTIEPGIYLPGQWGIRIEDMVLVEQDGCRVLTKTSKTLETIN